MIKIKLLLLTLFVSFQYKSISQSSGVPLIVPSTDFSSGINTYNINVNSPATGLGPLVVPGVPRLPGNKVTVPFMEFGDGAFSMEAAPQHILGRQNYKVSLFAASYYDTTRPKAATRLASFTKTVLTGNYSTNNPPFLGATDYIRLSSNVSEIVQGDYTNFVLTYKLPDTVPNPAIPFKYRIVVLYNNNPVFNTINTTDLLPNGVNRVRLFYFDQLASDADNLVMYNKIKSNPRNNFQKIFTVDCGQTTFTERNLFFTAFTGPNVELNSVTSLYAALIRSSDNFENWTLIDDYFINSMPVALAHDPNYITQTGRCILLPKKEKTIKYHVHFQNDGKGQAGKVVVKVKLPPGINNSNIKFGSATCGENVFQLSEENTNFEDTNYTLTIKFLKQGERPLLMGTDNNVNPYINPNTMGDIFFNVSETVITNDTLPAYADIFFYNLNTDSSLPAVRTNLAASVYKIRCDGSNIAVNCDTVNIWHKKPPSKNCLPGCYKLLSICWYWWLLLIAVFWIIYRIIKRNRSNTNRQSGR